MPQRIQRKRTKGWRTPPNTVIVTRGSHWGNPNVMMPDQGGVMDVDGNMVLVDRTLVATTAVNLHREQLLEGRLPYTVEDVVDELRGKNIACWCPVGMPCHGETYIQLANR